MKALTYVGPSGRFSDSPSGLTWDRGQTRLVTDDSFARLSQVFGVQWRVADARRSDGKEGDVVEPEPTNSTPVPDPRPPQATVAESPVHTPEVARGSRVQPGKTPEAAEGGNG